MGFVRERLLEPGEPDLRVPAARAGEGARRAPRERAADLSPQIWALLTLESWLRQEKGWGCGLGPVAALH